jgi:hypothetical protein
MRTQPYDARMGQSISSFLGCDRLIPCAASMLLAAATGADTIVYADGTFVPTNWTINSRPYGPFGGSGTGGQVFTGGAGDNGPARVVVNTCGPANSGAYNASILTAATYSPALQGAVSSIRISVDARLQDALCAIGAVVVQGDVVWMWGYQIDTPTWSTYTFNCDGTDVWYQILPTGTQLGAGPDFSAAGAPMQFGFWSGNGSGPGGGGYSTTSLFDNFRVELTRVAGCTGDLDADGVVSGSDLGLLLGNWGQPGIGDVDGSGTVDGADLGLLLGAWGPCP